MPAKHEITGRVVWNAACRMRRKQLRLGIKRPIFATGAVRPDVEREIDTGRVTGRLYTKTHEKWYK
jgi:hypothetical protein